MTARNLAARLYRVAGCLDPRRRGDICPPACNEGHVYRWPCAMSAPAGRRPWARGERLHHLVAHPLLVIAPPLGGWLHARTEPPGEPDAPAEDMVTLAGAGGLRQVRRADWQADARAHSEAAAAVIDEALANHRGKRP